MHEVSIPIWLLGVVFSIAMVVSLTNIVTKRFDKLTIVALALTLLLVAVTVGEAMMSGCDDVVNEHGWRLHEVREHVNYTTPEGKLVQDREWVKYCVNDETGEARRVK